MSKSRPNPRLLCCVACLSGNGICGLNWVAKSKMVAEGIRTTQSTHALATKMSVDLPLAEATYRVLFEGLPAREAIELLMSRDAKPE